MTSATVNGISIEYETYGEGEPLLLEMGLGGQLVAWPMDWVNLLAEQGFRVIRYDNRDVGLSSKTARRSPGRGRMMAAVVSRRFAKAPYLLSDMADDAAALLDHLEIERAHAVGVSMGGMIAQSLAIEHPARVASLTSIMSNTGDRTHGRVHPKLLTKVGKIRSKSRADYVDKQLLIFRLISGEHYDVDEIRALAEEALARDYDPSGTIHQLMAIGASPDRTAALRSVTAPTLVIHGLRDPLVLPSGGIATARAVPGSRLLMFPDMGHDLPRPRWGEIVEAIVQNAERGGFKRRTVQNPLSATTVTEGDPGASMPPSRDRSGTVYGDGARGRAST
jgi:pimeloyl-ACP methyl ester carboxylesterase